MKQGIETPKCFVFWLKYNELSENLFVIKISLRLEIFSYEKQKRSNLLSEFSNICKLQSS